MENDLTSIPPQTQQINLQEKEIPQVSFGEVKKIKFYMSPIHGRGVVATQDIEQNEIIERCPLIPLMHRSRYQTEPNIWRYCYPKPLCDCTECNNHGFLFFMVTGHGMIYNHQDNNNARMQFNFKELYVDVIAVRPIKSGEEVFVTYGEEYFKNIPKKSIEDVIPKS